MSNIFTSWSDCKKRPMSDLYMLSCFSCVQLFPMLWTVACQAPLSMGFSSQEYWSELSCPPPGGLPNPGIEPALAVRFLPLAPPGKPNLITPLS